MDAATAVGEALDAEPTDATRLEGGMVGEVHRVALADGRTVVAKAGDTPLDVEASMLGHLADAGLAVPDVLYAAPDLLVLSAVPGDHAFAPAVERDAADRLADLHDTTARGFGFPHDTLTGPLRQPNPWTDSWVAFFRDHRVRHALGEAREAGALPGALADRVRAAAADLDDLLAEPGAPALVHGDVWTTNVLAADDRVTAFLDPACYYAHPEVELAYVAWTDTFGDAFFERYRERRGVDPGFDDRRPAYRLYPLLVHVALFGGSYVGELDATLDELGY